MSRRLLPLALAACASVLAACGGGDGGADGPIPKRFFGIVAPEILEGPKEIRDRDLPLVQKTNVGLARQVFRWRVLEPRRGAFSLSSTDGIVASAAEYGIDVLPVLSDPPDWAVAPGVRRREAGADTPPPASPTAMAPLARRLVERYGPDGTLWEENPDLPKRPITAWQVWNEPNLPAYWGGEPDPAAYTKLLAATARALRAADPEAEVVTAGLPDSRLGVPLETFVKGMYRAGAKGAFDTLAIHPYSANDKLLLEQVQGARRLLDAQGDRGKGLWVTEFGWATGGPASPFTVSDRRQAELIRSVITKLAERRKELGLRGLVYYNWRDQPAGPGQSEFFGLFTGLIGEFGSEKPSRDVYRQAVEAAQEGK